MWLQFKKMNMLTIIKELNKKWNQRYVLCKCNCWTIKSFRLANIKNWNTKSCGCYNIKRAIETNTIHWKSYNKIYFIWQSMKARCDNPKHKHYKNYWWRWIKYCNTWKSFTKFYEDMKDWYQNHLTIERSINDWWYSKENCKWATRTEQNKNRRNNRIYKWKCLSEWSKELWINISTIYSRLNYWQTIKEALRL